MNCNQERPQNANAFWQNKVLHCASLEFVLVFALFYYSSSLLINIIVGLLGRIVEVMTPSNKTNKR